MNDLLHPFELVSKAIGCDPQSITEDSEMYRDHGWDSLGHLKVVLALEQEYGIVIDDTTIERYKTMREILRCYENIKRRQKISD